MHVCRRAALHQLAQNCDILFNSAVKAGELDEHSRSKQKRVEYPSRNILPERKPQVPAHVELDLQLSRQPPHDGLVQSHDAMGLQRFENAVEDQTGSHGGDEKADNASDRIDAHWT